MTSSLRCALLTALLLAMTFAASAVADDDDGGDGRPATYATAPTNVGDDSATLKGYVWPNGRLTSYYFDYGPTTSYGSRTTPASAGSGNSAVAVSAGVSGLAPSTTYHVRLVASNGGGAYASSDRSFSTAAEGASVPDQPSEAPPTSQPGSDIGARGPTPLPETAPELTPELGRTVVASTVRGTVLVREPASRRFVALEAADGLPVGSVIDVRRGTVELRAATDDIGASQTGRFWGAVFQVRQSRGGNGMTDLHLRAGKPTGCKAAARGKAEARRAAAGPSKRRRPQLWGNDKSGRFRTHGRNSVATVRGTTWMTAERCDGTLTRVTEGAVSVLDRGAKQAVLVTAGKSHLAPGPR